MQSNEKSSGNREKEAPSSPHYLPDIPLPTPPPMANIMMTSRFDLQTRGGCGYRRILSSRSTDFGPGRSPIFPRSSTFQRDKTIFTHYRDRCLSLSPLPVRRTSFDNTSRPPLELPKNQKPIKEIPPKSKYLSGVSMVSEEMKEVEELRKELQKKFRQGKPPEVSPEYQSVYFNEHFMSDIDENEEIKEFSVGYKTPDTDVSDDTSGVPMFYKRKSMDVNYSLSTNMDYDDVFDSGVFMKYYNLDSVYPGAKKLIYDDPRKFQTISSLDLRYEMKKSKKRCSKRSYDYDFSASSVSLPGCKIDKKISKNARKGLDDSPVYKSSEYCSDSPGSVNAEEFADCSKAVTKGPYRPVVKLANIR